MLRDPVVEVEGLQRLTIAGDDRLREDVGVDLDTRSDQGGDIGSEVKPDESHRPHLCACAESA